MLLRLKRRSRSKLHTNRRVSAERNLYFLGFSFVFFIESVRAWVWPSYYSQGGEEAVGVKLCCCPDQASGTVSELLEGKDRYPYPVGYQAVRTHCGITYRMEIREGLKGPIFAVISPDGDSCTGQTPDIAWESFQKKSCLRVKNWLGKRFSSKIDGVELFGFRNPFVQRLLRELVANVNGVAERSSVVPTFPNKTSNFDHTRVEESNSYLELLPFLGKQQITGKRSMNYRSPAENPIKESGVKRTRSQVLQNNAKCNSSYQEGPVCFFSISDDVATIQVTSSHLGNSLGDGIAVDNNKVLHPVVQDDDKTVGSTSTKTCDIHADPDSLVQTEAADAVEKNCYSLQDAKEGLMEPNQSECILEKNSVFHEESSPIGHKNPIHTRVATIQFDKSFDAELEQTDSLTTPQNCDREHVDLVTHPNICVPDTCATEKDSIIGSPSEGFKTSLCSMRNEISVARPVLETSVSCASSVLSRSLPENFAGRSNPDNNSMHPMLEEIPATCTPVDSIPKNIIKDSLPEIGSSSGSSNPSSDKVDLDLAGQELARSMMTFLLPRAVPLLTKIHVKRRSGHRNRKTKYDPCSTSSAPNPAEVERKHPIDQVCQGEIVAKGLGQGPEGNMQEKMNDLQALPATGSPRQIIRVDPLSGCMTTELCTESEDTKAVKSVIPDSFEDDQCAHDVATKRKYHPSLGETDIAFLDGIKGNVNHPILPEDSPERRTFSFGNDGSNGKILLPNGDEKDNAKSEVPSQFSPKHGLPMSENAAYSDQDSPCTHKELEDEVLTIDVVQSPVSCYVEKAQQNGRLNFDVHVASDSMDAYIKNQEDASHIGHVGHGKEESIAKESIICRKYENCNSSEMHFPQITPGIDEKHQASYTGSEADLRIPVRNTVKADGELSHLITVDNVPTSVHAPSNAAPAESQIHDVDGITETKSYHMIDCSVSSFIDCMDFVSELNQQGECCTQSKEQSIALDYLPCSDVDPQIQEITDLDCKGHSCAQIPQISPLDDFYSGRDDTYMKDSMGLVGCYSHPDPVLSISLINREDSLQISVLCGRIDRDTRSLFMYLIPFHEYRENCPSFLGYTSLMLPLKEQCYQNIPIDRSGLQFTPDNRSIVFLTSIKVPRCKEQNFDCSCTNCTSNYTEENSVEIAHVNFGYVSSVIKLVSRERISSLLAFEPNYVIAAELSGKLHVWVMNLEWSMKLDEFMLPGFEETLHMILELKRIPNCSTFVLGHNGFGGFALWDVLKRVRLAMFSSPGITTLQILPVCLLKSFSKDTLMINVEMEPIEETTPTTDYWCHKAGEEPTRSLAEEDIAVWLLVAAESRADSHHQMDVHNRVPAGCWRLGLLVKNAVVLGNILDPRASTASIVCHHGIYGTCDGFLYKWELSSGKQLASLRPFKCGGVSNIAIDAKSGAVAVAGDGGQLLVYAQPRMQR